jgi:hypothetical protein
MSEQKLLSKEQIVAMCEKLEEIASDQNNEETTICVFPEGMNRVWIDQANLDWLADELEEPIAQKMRDLMKYNSDFGGGYYYYDF